MDVDPPLCVCGAMLELEGDVVIINQASGCKKKIDNHPKAVKASALYSEKGLPWAELFMKEGRIVKQLQDSLVQ